MGTGLATVSIRTMIMMGCRTQKKRTWALILLIPIRIRTVKRWPRSHPLDSRAEGNISTPFLTVNPEAKPTGETQGESVENQILGESVPKGEKNVKKPFSFIKILLITSMVLLGLGAGAVWLLFRKKEPPYYKKSE